MVTVRAGFNLFLKRPGRTRSATLPALTELSFVSFGAFHANPGLQATAGVNQEGLDQLPGPFELVVFNHPQFRPALSGRQFAGRTLQIVITYNTRDMVGFQQGLQLAAENGVMGAVDTFHRRTSVEHRSVKCVQIPPLPQSWNRFA